MLTEIAKNFDGDVSEALTELVHAHEGLEEFMDYCESEKRFLLIAQTQRAEEGFRSGRFTTWDEIRRRNGL